MMDVKMTKNDNKKVCTHTDFGIGTNNSKNVDTTLEIVKIESVLEEPFKKSLRNETEVTACSVSSDMTVFGPQVRAASDFETTMNNSKEVGTVIPAIVKTESAPEEPLSESSKNETEVDSCNMDDEVKAIEFSSLGNVISVYGSVSKCQERCLKTELDVEVKRENEDKSLVTHELVGYFPGEIVCEKEELHVDVKCENSFKDEIHFVDSVGNDDVSSLVRYKPATTKTSRKTCNRSPTHRKVFYNSSTIKLVDVSVELEDLFPTNLRKLGKAHSNTVSCQCVYCQGKYRYRCDSFHLSTDLQNKEQLMPSQKLSDKSGADLQHQQGSNVKKLHKKPKNKIVFQCDRCFLKCKNRNALNIHLPVHGNPYKCKFCPEQFAREASLHSHWKKHNVDKPFKCNQCPAKFWYESILETHLRVHSKEKPFECKQCSAKFTQECAVKVHMRVHKAKRLFKCAQCPADFKFKSNLTVHLRVHSGEKPFECKHCPLRFMTSSNLKNHMRLHTGEKPFKCKLCPLKFAQSSTVRSHIKNIHSNERPFKCKLCPAKFKWNSYLNVHLRVHSGEKPFKCKLCPFKSSQSSGLNTHLRVHSGERPFECNLCPLKFKQRSALNEHLATHSDEKPFTCNLCPAKFKQKKGLNSHLTVHSGEEPFKCTLCPKKFKRKESLNSHLEWHAIDTPLSCAHCSRKFNKRRSLVNHLRKCLRFNLPS